MQTGSRGVMPGQAESSEHVDFTITEGVGLLRLLRPAKRNAITVAMWESVVGHLDRAAGRDDLRVLVVRGSGGSFCAGADLSVVKDAEGRQSSAYKELAVRGLSAIADLPVPSVAVIEGACIGAGVSLALACDLRLAHPESILGVPAVRHGIIYDADSIDRLAALMGPSRAARFLYTAERHDGHTAASLGLVDECREDLDVALAELVDPVLLGDPHTITATRALLRPRPTVLAPTAR